MGALAGHCVEHQHRVGRDGQQSVVPRTSGQPCERIRGCPDPGPRAVVPHRSHLCAPASAHAKAVPGFDLLGAVDLYGAVRRGGAQPFALGARVVERGAGVAHHAGGPRRQFEREQVGMGVPQNVVGAVRAGAQHRLEFAALESDQTAVAFGLPRRWKRTDRVAAGLQQVGRVHLAKPGVAEEGNVAVAEQ